MGWGLFDGFKFKVADAEECRLAMRLRDQVYGDDLGHVPNDGQDQGAHHLIALDAKGAVAAAFRVVQARPFDFERFVSINVILGPHRSPALIGRLCVREDYRGVRKTAFLQMGMLKLAHSFAARHAITDFFLYTYPNLINFYRGAFFDLLDITFPHPDWGDVHLMRMDVVGLGARCARSRTAIARLLSAGDLPNFQV